MEVSDALVALVGAVVGGGITGYFTLKATDKAIRDQNQKEQRREEKEIENLLDAISVEIRALWDFHMKRVGLKVEALPDGQPLEFYYPLTQDYFTIYNSNAGVIGKIKDCDISEAVVVCYNKCKKAVDAFKYNNDLLKEYRDCVIANDGNPLNQARVKAARESMIACAKLIKEDHFELKGYIERLQKLLGSRAHQ